MVLPPAASIFGTPTFCSHPRYSYVCCSYEAGTEELEAKDIPFVAGTNAAVMCNCSDAFLLNGPSPGFTYIFTLSSSDNTVQDRRAAFIVAEVSMVDNTVQFFYGLHYAVTYTLEVEVRSAQFPGASRVVASKIFLSVASPGTPYYPSPLDSEICPPAMCCLANRNVP